MFTSFDFHITPEGPRLIEINTNAAGALLVDALERFNQIDSPLPPFIPAIRQMFETVFAEGHRIAIVDEDPHTQKTRFEFKMVAGLLESWGWNVRICAPDTLNWNGQSLTDCAGHRFDGIYNRSCDFELQSPISQSLKIAFEQGFRISPHPDEYRRIADKRKLGEFATMDHRLIKQWIPPIIEVASCDRDWLWSHRKGLFFKPIGSYGSKAAYKGDRISRKTFESLWSQPMIAQQYAPPATTLVNDVEFKYDIRVYTFAGKIQLVGARLFQGQVMNFKIQGGGFAPIHWV